MEQILSSEGGGSRPDWEVPTIFIHSFHWHVQNATIPCPSQELLPFLSVMYFFLLSFSTSHSSILPHFILPSISWSASQSCCSQFIYNTLLGFLFSSILPAILWKQISPATELASCIHSPSCNVILTPKKPINLPGGLFFPDFRLKVFMNLSYNYLCCGFYASYPPYLIKADLMCVQIVVIYEQGGAYCILLHA